jgi:DNA-binding NtrC family response regulator
MLSVLVDSCRHLPLSRGAESCTVYWFQFFQNRAATLRRDLLATVLIVGVQERARDLLGAELREAGFEVALAADGEEAWRTFCARGAEVVVTDLAMPRCDGIELLRRIRQRSDVPVIVFSGHGSIETAAAAFKAGADDFVSSLDLEIDDLIEVVRRSAASGPAPRSGFEFEERLAGQSPAISRIRWQISGLAPLFTPVLVSGEPGTGRSLPIRAMHELGATAAGKLHRIDSASFVPAQFADAGAICAVHLEDVEHLTPDAQRYWSNRIARSETSSLPSAMRIFASTSTSLDAVARTGAFDARLAKALLRFEVEMPPLRDRGEDVPDIARVLLERIGRSVGRPRIQLSSAAVRFLEDCRFTENVRQLERLLERAVAYSLGKVIRRQTLQDLMAELESTVAGMREERQLLEREKLLKTLRETGGNITHTAEALEKSRAAVYRLISKYDIPLARRTQG